MIHARLCIAMNMQRLTKTIIVLVVSTITSWIGAELDHGNWFGVTSTIFGIVGLGLGYYIANILDNYINP
jgi:hypothetical protein